MPDSYCAVASDSSSPDSIWFIKIIDTLETNVEITDNYENKIVPRKSCIEGRFMENVEVSAKDFFFELYKRKTYFFKESVVTLFLNLIKIYNLHSLFLQWFATRVSLKIQTIKPLENWGQVFYVPKQILKNLELVAVEKFVIRFQLCCRLQGVNFH